MMRNDDPRGAAKLHVALNWWHVLEARAGTGRSTAGGAAGSSR
jgi:hypothetical protein